MRRFPECPIDVRIFRHNVAYMSGIIGTRASSCVCSCLPWRVTGL